MRVSEVMLGQFLAWTAPVVGLQGVKRDKRYRELMRTRQCPVCEQTVHYYYKDFRYGNVPVVKKAFQMKCCAWPIHKQCYWEKIVHTDTCEMCNTNLEQEASKISEYQIDGEARGIGSPMPSP